MKVQQKNALGDSQNASPLASSPPQVAAIVTQIATLSNRQGQSFDPIRVLWYDEDIGSVHVHQITGEGML